MNRSPLWERFAGLPLWEATPEDYRALRAAPITQREPRPPLQLAPQRPPALQLALWREERAA